MDDEEVPKVKKVEYKSKRFFISSLNTYFVKQLVELLQNTQEHPEDPNQIVGTTVPESTYPVPAAVKLVVDPFKLQFLAKVLLDSDVIIYDINTCDPSEAEYAIKTLKLGTVDSEKLLILVSSVMVWSDTEPKEKKAGEEDDDPLPPESEEEVPPDQADKPKEDEGEDPPAKKEYVRFTEADYPRRKPLQQYEGMRSLETLCLAAGKQNLKTFILSAGILYGMGEQQFHDHFKQAWLQQSIPYYGNGKNRIPCIHVKDLALFVAKVAERPPNTQYIFAIDHNPNPQQKKIVDIISKGVGNAKIHTSNEKIDELLIDLRMKPTKAFDAFIEEAAGMEEPEEGVVQTKYTFNWWCKEGIRANIPKIRKEFIDFHNLQPIRVFITGAPAIGKSTIGQELAEYFNVPLIQVKPLLEQYLSQNNEEVETLKGALEDTKRTLVEEAQAQYDIQRKKRKQLGQLYVPFDESKIEAKLTEEQLYQVYKWRLNQNDCQNRGFIIDGFPKTYSQAKGLFMIVEGEDTEDRKVSINKLILPNHVIVMNGADDKIISRLKGLKQHNYNEEALQNRLKRYRQNNVNKGFPLLLDFFRDEKVEVLEVDAFNKQNLLIEQCRSFIERDGKYNNYQTHEIDKESLRLQQKKEEVESKLKNEQLQRQKQDEHEKQLWKLAEEEYKIKQQQAGNIEKELLDSKSLPLRQYLNDNIVPFITEGLVEIGKQGPEDPVEFLAEFLFKRSLQVKFADPGKYFEKSE